MANYYVDALYGDNSYSGEDPDAAKQSLANGLALLSSPGDRLRLSASQSFNDEFLVENLTGTEPLPYVIESYDPGGLGRRATIDGSGVSLTQGGTLFGRNLKYVTFSGINVVNSPGYGIQIYRYEPNYPAVQWPSNIGVKFIEVCVDQSEYGGLLIEYGQACEIDQCIVQRTNRVDGPDEAVSFRGCEDSIVVQSVVRWCGEEGIDFKDSSLNCKMLYNLVHNCNAGLYLNHARSCEVKGNIVHSCGLGTLSGQRSGINMAVGDGSLTLEYDVSGLKDRDHADVIAAIAAGTPIDVTVTASDNSTAARNRTSYNLIHHNFSGFNGYAGFANVVSSTDGAMQGNVIANNVFYKNGVHPAASYGSAIITEPDTGTVTGGNTYINNYSGHNNNYGYMPKAGDTWTNNVSKSDTSGSVDKTTAVIWGMTSGDANTLESNIDTESGLHTEPTEIYEGGDGSLTITDWALTSSLTTAGDTVTATKHDASSWPAIDDSSIGVDNTYFPSVVVPFDYSAGALDSLSRTVTVGGTDATQVFEWYGASASTYQWLSRHGQEYGIEYKSGTPGQKYASPYSDGDNAVNLNGAIWRHDYVTYNQPTTGSIYGEIAFRHTTDVSNDQVLFSTQNSDSNAGITAILPANTATIKLIFNDATGAVSITSSGLTTNAWHFVQYGWDRSVGLWLRVDNVADGTQAAVKSGSLANGTLAFTVGARPDNSDPAGSGTAIAYASLFENTSDTTLFSQADSLSMAQTRYLQALSLTPAPDDDRQFPHSQFKLSLRAASLEKTITTAGTFYQVSTAPVFSNDTEEFSESGGVVTYLGKDEREYMYLLTGSLKTTASGDNGPYTIGLSVSDSVSEDDKQTVDVLSEGKEYNFSLCGVVTLVYGDSIYVAATTDTDGAKYTPVRYQLVFKNVNLYALE